MHIYVKTLKGNANEIAVSQSHSIQEVKQVISLQLGIPVEEQKLVFQGKALVDQKCLDDYKIKDGAKLFLFKKKDSEVTPSTATETQVSSSMQLKHGIPAAADGSFLWQSLKEFLLRHFTGKDAERVFAEFKKEFDSKLASLSLDDIERLASKKLGRYSLESDERLYADCSS